MIYFIINRFPAELFVWTAALILFAMTEPGTNHFTLCPLDNMGINWCPGCGLGRSIRYFLHGEFLSSIRHHWFGIPATFILIYRIIELTNNFYKFNFIKKLSTWKWTL